MKPVTLTLELLLAGLIACEANPQDPLPFTRVRACLHVPEAAEPVFRTSEEWAAFHRRYGSGGDPPPIDFSSRMVVARFDGMGSACTHLTVEAVLERENGVVVRATRHVSPGACIAVLAYPQIVLEVERREGPVSFDIREVRDTIPGDACL